MFQDAVKQPEPEDEEPSPSFSFGDVAIDNTADSTVRMESFQVDSFSADSAAAPAGEDDFSLSSLADDKGFEIEPAPSSSQDDISFDEFD
ncbi:MAG: hypothetical protein Q7V04_02320, partial [Deltaproteobacteria bacterium]|nr:hypothetical protein [Deltaproteobacteria bacterium]